MTEDTRQRILRALRELSPEEAETTIKGIAEATGMSYGKVHRAMGELQEDGVVEDTGEESDTGATVWTMTRAGDATGREVEAQPAITTDVELGVPIEVGESFRLTGLVLELDAGSDPTLTVKLEDDAGNRLRALVLEEVGA